ncbi:MAG: hypothetical protein ACK4E8_10095 [Lacibacter sp.]|jgi:hypothetical protein
MNRERYKKIVMVSFGLSVLGLIIFLSKYLAQTEAVQSLLGASGLGLMVASMVLRWSARLKPEWFEKSEKK